MLALFTFPIVVLVFAVSAEAHSKDYGSKKNIKIPKCPYLFEFIDGECKEKQMIPEQEVCPVGSFDNGASRCIETTSGNIICDEGTYIGSLTCEAVDMKPGKLVCPENTTPQQDDCIVGGPVEYCPAGSALTPEANCIVTAPKDYYCAGNLQEVGCLCLHTSYKDPLDVCPDGMTSTDGKCYVDIRREKECPVDYAAHEDVCYKLFPKEKYCSLPEFEYHPEDVVCSKFLTIEATPTCVDGGEIIDGICTKEQEVKKVPFCDEGELVPPDMCKVTSIVPPKYKCPEHYHLVDGDCVAEVSYDCSITKYECADESEPEKKDAGHGLQNLKSTPWKPASKSKSFHEHHFGYCQQVKVEVPKTCTEIKTADPIPYCEEGKFVGNGCELSEEYPAEWKCLTYEGPEGQCLITVTYDPVYMCLDGFSPIEDGRTCVQKTQIVPSDRCPADTQEFGSDCAVFAKPHCPAEGCFEVEYLPVIKTCPIGYALESESKKITGHHNHDKKEFKKQAVIKCIKNTYHEKESRCPISMNPISETTCAKLVDPTIIENEKSVAPGFKCPMDYALSKRGDCRSISFNESIVVCTPDTANVPGTGVCIKEVDVVLECPYGANEWNNKCFIVLSTEPYLIEKSLLRVPLKKNLKTKPTRFYLNPSLQNKLF